MKVITKIFYITCMAVAGLPSNSELSGNTDQLSKVSCKYNWLLGPYWFQKHRPLGFDKVTTLEGMEETIRKREVDAGLEVLKSFNVPEDIQQQYATDRTYLKGLHYQTLLAKERPDVFHDPAIPAEKLTLFKQALRDTGINPNAVDIKQEDLPNTIAMAASSLLINYKPTITINKEIIHVSPHKSEHIAGHEVTHVKEAHADMQLLTLSLTSPTYRFFSRLLNTYHWFSSPLMRIMVKKTYVSSHVNPQIMLFSRRLEELQKICLSSNIDPRARAYKKVFRRLEETADLLPLLHNPHLLRTVTARYNSLLSKLKEDNTEKFYHYPEYGVQRNAVKMLYYIDKIRALHFEKKYFKDERQFILTQPF